MGPCRLKITAVGITQLIKILSPLNSEERYRNIEAALAFLGEKGLAAAEMPPAQQLNGGGGHSPGRANRMKQHKIVSEHVEQVFNISDDDTFDILDVPGTSKKERTLNMYVLTGLGTFLTSGVRDFTDVLARRYCEQHGCYDQANHATILKGKHPEFSGDKSKGWTLTVPGIKRGAALIKKVADAASK